jgi:hypothetical protein
MYRKPHNMGETSIADIGGSGDLSTSLSNVARAGGTSKICVSFQCQLRWDNHL